MANVPTIFRASGASHAVSDITSAGILFCDAGSLAQDIRVVCSSSTCEHLFEGHGAIDTVVCLPETVDVTSTGNITNTVFIVSVDTDFAAINSTKTGPVSFNIEGYNYPVENLDMSKRDANGLKIRSTV
ncbi:hypothetical protein B0H17DRAFT_1191653 [Mycena rosella]|uniref:Uncharacterized protein n=1 Tax=Mycena rosella TaxID=1033263 RepID=A0AAD7MAL2_MYCRO|nr:hypothetical protein B0H17DRAFT_1191653 [Mycena rosella]